MKRQDSLVYLIGVAGPYRALLGGIVLVAICSGLVRSADPDTVSEAQRENASARSQAESDSEDFSGHLQSLEAAVRRLQEQDPNRPVPEDMVREVEFLKWITLLQKNCAVAATRKAELQQHRERLQEEKSVLQASGFAQQGPASFLALDDIRDQLEGETRGVKSMQLEMDAMKASLSSSRERLENVERDRRSAREAMELNTSVADAAALARNYQLAKLSARVFQEAVRQQRLDLEVKELELELGQIQSEVLREKIASMQGEVRFSEEELAEKIAAIDQVEAEARQQIEALTVALRASEHEWLKAKNNEHTQTEPVDPTFGTTAAWDFVRESQQEQLSVMNRLLVQAGIVRECWRRRHSLANDVVSPLELAKWEDGLPTIQSEIERLIQLIEIRADERLAQLATFRKRLTRLREVDAEPRRLLQTQIEEAERSIDLYRNHLVLLNMAERIIGRFTEELTAAVAPDSMTDWIAQSKVWFKLAWNYEITSVDDRPITISKIVRGLMLLLIGQFFARYLSRFVGKRLLTRVGMSQGAISAFQSLIFYSMLICCVFVALEIINLPLTVFAFMGGAIAIGVGFGSQNVLNNFISGLILLAESPVRVGDLVDIQGLQGTIEHIGARSTRLKTGANIEIIVPNSTLLENNVTNWTLSDTRLRTMVSVGVAYGSPVQEVIRHLENAVLEHPLVLPAPSPIILFTEFGDNSLNFEVHFWIHMRTLMEKERVNSDIRVSVERLFDESGISIAFPQRDVHLDTIRPIEVNLRQGAELVDRVLRREAA